jgi:hypothetical protein
MYYFYKLMWYIRLCLKGERFPSGVVHPDDMLVQWLVSRHEFLLPLDCDCYFDVIEYGVTEDILDTLRTF